MALIESQSIPMDTPIPEFNLADPNGNKTEVSELFSEDTQGVLIGFLCNHCPYAIAVWPKFIQLAQEFRSSGIQTIAINPNIHPSFPEDAPDQMLKKIKEWGIDFPYLVDEKQEVARSFNAQCTPDLFLFNHHKKLVYHGRMDDNWRNPSQVKKDELRDALKNLISNQTINPKQYPSIGCSIKWR